MRHEAWRAVWEESVHDGMTSARRNVG